MSVPKCQHGYFERSLYNRCPWCHGQDANNRDAVPVIGHGNGWLLRQGNLVCPSCGGPRSAGWGMYTGDKPPDYRDPAQCPPMCYSCEIGDNTKETIAHRAVHEATRGVKKVPGAKP